MAPRAFIDSIRSPRNTTAAAQPTQRDRRNDPEPHDASVSSISISLSTALSHGPAQIPTTTRPMGIPSSNRSQTMSLRREKSLHSSNLRRQASPGHNADAISPSVAALLAITTIPPLKKNGKEQRNSNGRRSDSWFEDEKDADLDFILPSTPLSILLSPPDEEDADRRGYMIRKDSIASVRSDSSESIPSLSGDNESISSFYSPQTPSIRRANLMKLARLQVEDCAKDHPLAAAAKPPVRKSCDTGDRIVDSLKSDTNMADTQQTSFKSNLTASLRAFKSAALSLSNLTNVVIPPEDLLTRSILTGSSRFTDERRPPHLHETPSPAVRRYFNPNVATSAPSLSLYDPASTEDYYTASIQLQMYRRPTHSQTPRTSSRKTSLPSKSLHGSTSDSLSANVTSSADTYSESPIARQRESRENSSFLRVICLEMAMRRAGKLSETSVGRARIALPPRTSSPMTKKDEHGVPLRWTSITSDTIEKDKCDRFDKKKLRRSKR